MKQTYVTVFVQPNKNKRPICFQNTTIKLFSRKLYQTTTKSCCWKPATHKLLALSRCFSVFFFRFFSFSPRFSHFFSGRLRQQLAEAAGASRQAEIEAGWTCSFCFFCLNECSTVFCCSKKKWIWILCALYIYCLHDLFVGWILFVFIIILNDFKVSALLIVAVWFVGSFANLFPRNNSKKRKEDDGFTVLQFYSGKENTLKKKKISKKSKESTWFYSGNWWFPVVFSCCFTVRLCLQGEREQRKKRLERQSTLRLGKGGNRALLGEESVCWAWGFVVFLGGLCGF